MKTEIRGLPNNWIFDQFQECRDLTEEMKETMIKYLLSLHGIKDTTKSFYISKTKILGVFLAKRGITRFENTKSIDMDLFLSQYGNKHTLNVYIYVFKQFYNFLNSPDAISHLKYYKIELEQITPSETLTPEEIIAIANEASKIISALNCDTRLEIIKILGKEPSTVGDIFQEIKRNQKVNINFRESIYRALEKLVDANLVEKYYDKEKGICYKLLMLKIEIDLVNGNVKKTL